MTTTPTTLSKNVSIVRTGLDAFQRADLETVKSVFTPDVRFRLGPSGGTFQREYRGVDDVLKFFADVYTATGGQLRFDTIGLTDCGDNIVAHFCITRGKRTDGRTLDLDEVQIYHMRDGRIAEIAVYTVDSDVAEAFWA